MSCGCDSAMGCTCQLKAGAGISITGIGTGGDPFTISNTRPQLTVADTPSLDLNVANGVISGQARIAPLLTVADTDTVDMSLSGGGTEASPLSLSAVIKGLILTGGVTGNVLTQKPDGTWGPGPMTTAPIGAISTANGVRGDGSGANPVRINARTYADWEAVVDGSVF